MIISLKFVLGNLYFYLELYKDLFWEDPYNFPLQMYQKTDFLKPFSITL